MVRLAGLEPATSGSTIRRSNQLSYNRTSACGWRGSYGQSIPISTPHTPLTQKNRKRPEGGSGLFYDRPDGRRMSGLCLRRKGGGFPAQEIRASTPQANLSSLVVFSKASLSGRAISSPARVEAACRSLACSTAVSNDLRANAVCSSISSASDFTATSA
jgi:hypothetical protein